MGNNPNETNIYEDYHSEDRGAYSDQMEYYYHNYRLDRKIPWARYIVFYVIASFLLVLCVLKSIKTAPVKLENLEEPWIVDKLGFYTDIDGILAEMKLLQEKTGVSWALITIPEDEYQTKVNDYYYVINKYYENYISDENHVLLVLSLGFRENDGTSYPIYDGIIGENAQTRLPNLQVAKVLRDNRSTNDVGIINALQKISSRYKKIFIPFTTWVIVSTILFLFLVIHPYIAIIRRMKQEKSEKTEIRKSRNYKK